MIGTAVELPAGDGVLSGVDFGGTGQGVLLVHGTGHNATAWADVAARLAGSCHPVAVDLRGHGQTEVDSTGPEQYWRDLGSVVAALSWQHPVLVGHSTGGYAVTAATAAGLLEPAALCVVDGMVLDDRATSLAEHARFRSPEAADQLRTTFRYGWAADDEHLRDHVDQCVRDADTDWLNAGARPALVREVTRRSFRRQGGRWVRRPSVTEIATVSDLDPGAVILPSVEVYRRISCPLTFVLASDGFYAARRAELQAVVNAAEERELIEISSHHNVPMTQPAELATIILGALPDRGTTAGSGGAG